MQIYRFNIEHNRYLNRDTTGFYHLDYLGYKDPNNPSFILTLKNNRNDEQLQDLDEAKQKAKFYIRALLEFSKSNRQFFVCVVPRAKVEQEQIPYLQKLAQECKMPKHISFHKAVEKAILNKPEQENQQFNTPLQLLFKRAVQEAVE